MSAFITLAIEDHSTTANFNYQASPFFHPPHFLQCQKDTEQTLRETHTTHPVDLTHRQVPANITRVATHPTTMPMTKAAHTTIPAPAPA